jgi:hypothetical protein
MRKAILILSLVVLPSVAQAQMPPPVPTGPETAEPKLYADGGLIIAMPSGEIEDLVDTSLGLAIGGGYKLNPNLSLRGTLRYVFVSVKDEFDSADISYFDIGVGGRYAAPISPVLSVFGEGNLLLTSTSVDEGSFSASESDMGLGFNAGMLYSLTPGKYDLMVHAGYTLIFNDEEGELDIEDYAWLSLGGSAVAYF